MACTFTSADPTVAQIINSILKVEVTSCRKEQEVHRCISGHAQWALMTPRNYSSLCSTTGQLRLPCSILLTWWMVLFLTCLVIRGTPCCPSCPHPIGNSRMGNDLFKSYCSTASCQKHAMLWKLTSAFSSRSFASCLRYLTCTWCSY
jgi:hypothetical protein